MSSSSCLSLCSSRVSANSLKQHRSQVQSCLQNCTWVHLHMHVCAHEYMHAYVRACVGMHTCVDMHAWVYIYLHMHICVHARASMHVCIQTRMHTSMHACMHVRPWKHACMHSCVMNMCIHRNIHSCKHACICAYIYKYACVHARICTCSHACIHCKHAWERDVMSGVMRERERESRRDATKEWFHWNHSFATHTQLFHSLKITPDVLFLTVALSSYKSDSLSTVRKPILSLLVSLSLSRQVRFYSNLSLHYILISLSHTHANSQSSPPFLLSSLRN
jgi:hypothetical protein